MRIPAYPKGRRERQSLVLQKWLARRNRFIWFAAVISAVLPLVWLLHPWAGFGSDWGNHIRYLNYFSRYLKVHGHPPDFYTYEGFLGVPTPLFYGPLFFPAVAWMGQWLGGAAALRLVFLSLAALQVRGLQQILLRLKQPRLALGMPILVVGASYALTNLYSRGALPEYAATACLTIAFLQFWRWSHGARRSVAVGSEEEALRGWYALSWVGLTHGITLIYGLLTLVLLAPLWWVSPRRGGPSWRQWGVHALGGVLFFLVQLPWIYLNLFFKDSLLIRSYSRQVTTYPTTLDAWWIRLMPVSFDIRPLQMPLEQISTPYLDAQMSGSLLLLAVSAAVVIWRRAPLKRLHLVYAGVVLGVLFLFSLSAPLWGFLPVAWSIIQYPYRLISELNLTLIGILLVALSHGAGRPIVSKKIQRWALGFGLASLGISFAHTRALVQIDARNWIGANREDVTRAVGYQPYDYSTPGLYPQVPPASPLPRIAISFQDLGEDGSGEVRYSTITLNPPSPSWACTNLIPFAWNHLYVDALEQRPPQLALDRWRLCVLVPTGMHTLAARSVLRPAYRALRDFSVWVIILWSIVLLFSWVSRRVPPAQRLTAIVIPRKKRVLRAGRYAAANSDSPNSK